MAIRCHATITDPNTIVNGRPALLASSAFGNPFLFTGRMYDAETRLYHYRTRPYEPRMGRFISVDSIGVWGDGANLGNGYAYVGNRPGDWVDPWGNCGFSVKCIHIAPAIPGSHCYIDFGDGDVGSAHNPPRWPRPGPITPYFGPFKGSPDELIRDNHKPSGDPLGPERTTPINCPEGFDCKAAKECIRKALEQIGNCNIMYDPLGPNSNTSLEAAIAKCLSAHGCSIVGKDGRPNTRPGAPPVGWPPIDERRSLPIHDCIMGDCS